jgi:hypothetical protein
MNRLVAFFAVLLVSAPALAKDYSVTATGRCVYDEGGTLHPVVGALVELRDNDYTPPDWDVVGPFIFGGDSDLCGSTHTGTDGRFSISGSCGDPGEGFWGTPNWTKPDLYVRCALEGAAGRMIGASAPWTLYNTRTNPRGDDASPLNVGDLKLPAGVSKAFNSLKTAHDKIQSLSGQTLLPVWVFYPGGHQAVIANSGVTYFASYTLAVFMSIAQGQEGGTVAHEYGHAMQFESFLFDWSTINQVLNILRAGWEAIQHATGAGHNFDTVSNPVMAYSEGWAEFHEFVVFGSGSPDCGSWKEIGANESQKVQVEGNIACRLQRLYKKWPYKDIWTAQTKSKAASWPDFMSEYLKIHPDAANVATPPALIAIGPIVAKAPLVLKPLTMTVAAPPAKTAMTFAKTLAVHPTVSSAVTATLLRAEGSTCNLVHDVYQRTVSTIAKACPSSLNAVQKKDCETKLAAAQARSQGLGKFCPTLHYARPLSVLRTALPIK